MPSPDVNNPTPDDSLQALQGLAMPTLLGSSEVKPAPLPDRVIIAFPLFFPVIVVHPGQWDRVAALGVKLGAGSLTEGEVDELARASASATFPNDKRGHELCKKLLISTNAINSARVEDGQPQINPSGAQALQLTQYEKREYSSRFVRNQCSTESDESNLRGLWSAFIRGKLEATERERLRHLLEENGQELLHLAGDIMVLKKKRGE